MKLEGHPAQHLDDTIHQRARLGIMAIVCEVKEADFGTIRSTLELTPGNLSQHLSVLEAAGLVASRKTFEGKKPRTWIRVTPKGRRAYKAELDLLRQLLDRATGDAKSS